MDGISSNLVVNRTPFGVFLLLDILIFREVISLA